TRAATTHAPLARETHRIRVANRAGGAVSVSLDGGLHYTEVAHVVHPATAAMNSFAAVAGAAPGTIAAITLAHWLPRVDAAEPASDPPRVVGICARGAGAGSAFTELDLPAAATLFTLFAPVLGSRAFVERQGTLSALRPSYHPVEGDTWVIVSEPPTQ